MPARWMKTVIGFSLMGLHLASLYLGYVWLQPILKSQELYAIMLTLAPLTALYALAFARDVVREMYAQQSTKTVSLNFAVLSIVVVTAFGFALIAVLHAFKEGISGNIDDLKVRLGLVETFLGAFIGLIAESLFGPLPDPPQHKNDPAA